ncbi:TPA: hypothetical protein QDZ60_000768 [Stenotrophomonas maltophilia]|nr:hypothetical protein [Stenotrophomonas maltophilia]MBH1502038.1 hypothetical protein [Stenotrophomonas maltophilia]HDS1123499.1 hypothetical protein [Stenotrophomonas maltophilia]
MGCIKGYTLAQFRAFSEASALARRRHLAEELMNLRAAQFEGSDYSAYLNKLMD